MVVISLFYIMIGVKLRESELVSVHNSPQYGKATATRARRAVLKMLGRYLLTLILTYPTMDSVEQDQTAHMQGFILINTT